MVVVDADPARGGGGGTREPAEKLCLPHSPPTCRAYRGGEISNRVISQDQARVGSGAQGNRSWWMGPSARICVRDELQEN